ncbi:DUF6318 family protein [Mumia sp. ZJ430]|uniref:DUF6318 family protein n=1 Tax=Mumia sp. ZJ430 TaxID=2708083 RepID=UPI001421E7E7|nr:DUF6318 family protein [Mumia sp. ZJ430]
MTRLGTALAAAVALLSVTACTGEEPAGGDPTSAPPTTASASPSPTPSAPTIPPEATKHSADGAAAFVKYFYAAMRYSATTGNSEILLNASTDECDTCVAMAGYDKRLHEAGGDYEDLPWSPTVTTSQKERDYFVVTTDVTTTSYRYKRRADAPWTEVSPKRRMHLFRIRDTADGWKVIHLTEQAKVPR